MIYRYRNLHCQLKEDDFQYYVNVFYLKKSTVEQKTTKDKLSSKDSLCDTT